MIIIGGSSLLIASCPSLAGRRLPRLASETTLVRFELSYKLALTLRASRLNSCDAKEDLIEHQASYLIAWLTRFSRRRSPGRPP